MLLTILKQAGSLIAIRIFGTALAVVISIVIARTMGPSALGAYSFMVILITIAAIPISTGWATILLRATAQADRIDGTVKAMARLGIRLSALNTLFAILLFCTVVYFLGDGGALAELGPDLIYAVPLLSAILLLDQWSALRMAQLRGLNHPTLGQMPETIVRPAVLGLGVVTVALFPFGQHGQLLLLVALLLASLSAAVVGFLVYRRLVDDDPVKRISPKQRREWLKSLTLFSIGAGLAQLNGMVDVFLLGAMSNAENVGFYRAAIQIASLANFGYMALNFLAGQKFARALANNDRLSLNRTARMLSRLALLTAIPVPLVLLFLGEEIFMLLFGPRFGEASLPALLVSFGFLANALVGMPSALLAMTHNEKLVARVTVFALVLNIVLCAVLIPWLGIVGAAIGNATAYTLWGATLWGVALSHTGFDTSALGLWGSSSDKSGDAVEV